MLLSLREFFLHKLKNNDTKKLIGEFFRYYKKSYGGIYYP